MATAKWKRDDNACLLPAWSEAIFKGQIICEEKKNDSRNERIADVVFLVEDVD